MREPDLLNDGWALENGEDYHRRAPSTFPIPARQDRDNLPMGAFAKLIFRISVDNPTDPESLERMWVIVRDRVDDSYFGVLDNEPDAIAENDEFWLGTEVPFRAEHIIAILEPDQDSIDLAGKAPRRAWPR